MPNDKFFSKPSSPKAKSAMAKTYGAKGGKEAINSAKKSGKKMGGKSMSKGKC